MKLITTSQDSDRWDQFVMSSGSACAYHRFAWQRVIEKSFGHKCVSMAAVDEDGTWRGVLPLVHMRSSVFGNFLVSVPFVNYGGVLTDSAATTTALLEGAEELRQSCGATHVELRHMRSALGELPTKAHKVTMLLSLESDVDTQWRALDCKVRNQVRKAQKSGLEFVEGHLDLLNAFYNVFSHNMRDLGTPVYSKEFFRNVLTEFAGSTRILAVAYKGQIIGAALASWFRETIEIPWASSIKDYKAFCPNNLLYWGCISYAIEHGFKTFDFGRSTPHEGTYNFKKQWGAKPVPLYWQYLLSPGDALPELGPKNPKYELAIKVWQKMPIGLTKLLGPHIVRSIP